MKVSTYPEGWEHQPCSSEEEKVELALKLVGGADTLRVRQEAEGALNGWGDNRFYIVVADQDRWIQDTETLLAEIMNKISSLASPMNIRVGGGVMLTHIVEV